MARSRQQYSRLGRLDNLGVLPSADSFYDDSPNQYVPCRLRLFVGACADLLPLVTYTGLGRDIWTIEFDNITLMLKVMISVTQALSEIASDI